jgi:cytochrome c-type biogenesis protein CcmE
MTPARKKRLGLILLMVAGVATGVGFALRSMNENIMFFFTPSEVATGKAPADRLFRVGGMVVEGSVRRPGEGLTVHFDLTDNAEVVTVQYGRLNESGEFVADEVLAKHDENYMPPELADMHVKPENAQ